MGKKTVAIIGDTGEFCPALTKAAVQQDFRLLFISRDEQRYSALKEQLGIPEQTAEIEFITCEKEGCWEADVIAFTDTMVVDPGLLKRIKQVATQKIVLVISHEPVEPLNLNFRELLPHSKVVDLRLKDKEFVTLGRNEEANKTVRNFFVAAGYHQKS
ncbi:hypothetical protein [Salinimicrobium terrae]|uniref:hypothetical protein n=1 Tax=Salinimicrobium terrae TaxID=470866 RepID=UPI0003F7D588|nr:hypothetical protein [Salinimicrobium terrae]